MKYRRLIAILLVVLLLLTGCGAESAMNGGAPMKDSANGAEMEDAGLMGSTSTETSKAEALPQNQKLIRKVWISAETEDLDALLGNVEERISQLSGYVEERQVYHGSKNASRRYRNGELTVRIPAEQLQSFVNSVGESANITSTRENTEDVTLSYVATESKKLALETEQARLLELLAKAESMEDILKIEARLTDVRSQLEGIVSQLRVYDNMVSYSTVYLSLSEVREYTVVQEPETVWERIGAGFVESWKDMCQGLEDVFVLAVCAVPYLLPLGVIVAAVIVVILGIKKNKKKRPPQPPVTEE